MDLGIHGKTAVIPGGSRGIGLACSRRLALPTVSRRVGLSKSIADEHARFGSR
jgi:NAD(P)-dependent dehydrogenase (short-subunit alcohol dehydrogenase family)